MVRTVPIALCLCMLLACSQGRQAAHKPCYRNTRTVLSTYWMGKLTDHYFKLKKKNYFVQYERILGLTKINQYTGSYVLRNDTLYLSYCDPVPAGLTGVGYLDEGKRALVLYRDNGIYNETFSIVKDKRKK